MTPVAMGVGVPRVVQGREIVSVLGDASRTPEDELKLRRRLVEKALEALQTEVKSATLFEAGK